MLIRLTPVRWNQSSPAIRFRLFRSRRSTRRRPGGPLFRLNAAATPGKSRFPVALLGASLPVALFPSNPSCLNFLK